MRDNPGSTLRRSWLSETMRSVANWREIAITLIDPVLSEKRLVTTTEAFVREVGEAFAERHARTETLQPGVVGGEPRLENDAELFDAGRSPSGL